MPQRKQTKLETEINEIVIVNNKKLNPYIELVNFSSRNIDQKKLGTILGIFEIKDTSEDSAYIVNFLSSVAKKTYFASHQKNPEESFESTLAKVNLSLSEVANHGNVNWIGKIDAVLCCVFENQINFSVTGDAKVLLLRNNKLTEISSGLSPKDEAINPLKTFTDISSGKLELGDKLILTTDDISHIFSLEDLEKYALSFKKDKFLRFLKTALVNELDIAGTIVIDTKKISEKIKEEKVEQKTTSITESTDKFNLFGSKAFEKENKNKEKISVDEALQKETQKKEYVHKQTGHIYISESDKYYNAPKEDKFDHILNNIKEKISDFKYWLNEVYLKKITYKIKKRFFSIFEKKETNNTALIDPDKSPSSLSIFFLSISQKTKNIFSKIKTRKTTTTIESAETTVSEKNFSNELPILVPKKRFPIKFNSLSDKKYGGLFKQALLKLVNFLYSKILDTFRLIKKTFPHLKKLKELFLQMSLRIKIVTIIIILFILIAPFIFFKNNNQNSENFSVETSANSEENLKINPSAQSYKEANSIYNGSDIIGTFVFNNTIFAISKNKITQIENKKDYSFPDNFRNAQYYSFMNDLNLLFLINDQNKLISFSPISLKFKEDTISFDNQIKIEGIESYLTYLYVVDSNNKQIYRYPRADDGFGEKINWLQSDINFDNITGLAIDGNLYLAKKDSVLKMFNRKLQDFNLKVDSNSSINGIFTNEDISSIYILDNLNGELDKFDKNGNKISFISNQNLTQATKTWVDEKNSVAYFIADNNIYKIPLP